MTKIVSATLWICLLQITIGQATAKDVPEAHIQAIVLGYPLAASIKNFNAELVEEGSGKDYSKQISIKEGLLSAIVPFGYYILRIKATGFSWHEEHLSAMQPQISFRIFLSIARISDGPVSVCQGRIVPSPPESAKLWVRLLPITGNKYYAENEVIDGKFILTGLPFGEYVLAIMKGTESIFLKQVTMLSSTEVTISLPHSPQ